MNDSLVKLLMRMFTQLYQNFLHIVCYVLHRMGLENIERNVWAAGLRDMVFTKSPFHRNG